MSRSLSRSRASENFGEHISELRRRVRGEHGAFLPSRTPLSGHVPPAPPTLGESELEQLRKVWRRLDVDGDGILTPKDLLRAVHSHGLRGVSKKDAYDMLWEVSLQPEPGLSFEGLTAAYARSKIDTSGHEPRRLYNYIVYSLMDADLNGTVSADEVYTHFYSFVADPGVVAGATWLLESMPAGEEELVSPGLFVRYMQSGALSSVADGKTTHQGALTNQRLRHTSKGKSAAKRPQSAPASRAPPPQAPPRINAKERFEESMAETRRQIERQKYVSAHVNDAAELSSLDLRRSRDCLVRGVTDVWRDKALDKQHALEIAAARNRRRILRGPRKAIRPASAEEQAAKISAELHIAYGKSQALVAE